LQSGKSSAEQFYRNAAPFARRRVIALFPGEFIGLAAKLYKIAQIEKIEKNGTKYRDWVYHAAEVILLGV
jgi:hypothetical protein